MGAAEARSGGSCARAFQLVLIMRAAQLRAIACPRQSWVAAVSMVPLPGLQNHIQPCSSSPSPCRLRQQCQPPARPPRGGGGARCTNAPSPISSQLLQGSCLSPMVVCRLRRQCQHPARPSRGRVRRTTSSAPSPWLHARAPSHPPSLYPCPLRVRSPVHDTGRSAYQPVCCMHATELQSQAGCCSPAPCDATHPYGLPCEAAHTVAAAGSVLS